MGWEGVRGSEGGSQNGVKRREGRWRVNSAL